MWCETRKSGLGIIWIRIRISTDTAAIEKPPSQLLAFLRGD